MIIKLPFKLSMTYRAITLGPVIIIWTDFDDEKLLSHETQHVAQWRSDPFLFYPKYIYYFLKNMIQYKSWHKAYRAIPYEVEARKAAGQRVEI